jgi:hypothetical protein
MTVSQDNVFICVYFEFAGLVTPVERMSLVLIANEARWSYFATGQCKATQCTQRNSNAHQDEEYLRPHLL